MDVETLRHYRLQEPFQAIRVRLADGDAIEIRNPQMLLVTEKQVVLGMPSPDHPCLPDVAKTMRMVGPDQIVQVEILSEAAT